ncbi:nucleotidyltransferase family protein [Virgibacillus sp. LDC-1]|uniref:nucleotidyltransferase family protein n=1 Tax=Virgibacillus sp. LDC-1 TaxID=3039856 RepID=UPI0024DE9232|nr:nucleotidyltransferase family protein [Virgibacillus sp. LDC-1]
MNNQQKVIDDIEIILEKKGFNFLLDNLVHHKILNFLIEDKTIFLFLSKRLEGSQFDTLLFLNKVTMLRNSILKKDLEKLSKEELDLIVYRGFVANFNFYSKSGLRVMKDIDLFIDRLDSEKINAALNNLGYKYGFLDESGHLIKINDERHEKEKSFYKQHVITFEGDYIENTFSKTNLFIKDNKTIVFYSEIEVITEIIEKEQTYGKNNFIPCKYYLKDMKYMGISPADVIYFTTLKFESDYSSRKHSWAYIYEITETMRNSRVSFGEMENIFSARNTRESWQFVRKYVTEFRSEGD